MSARFSASLLLGRWKKKKKKKKRRKNVRGWIEFRLVLLFQGWQIHRSPTQSLIEKKP
jgi:hypothetical protein